MYKLPQGEYTLVIEFFSPVMDQVTVSVVSTSLNIGQNSTKLFPQNSRSVIHLHKWDVTPPEYIYVDMRCQGTASSPAQGHGHLIVYGMEGKQNDVDSDSFRCFDNPHAFKNGKMTFSTEVEFEHHDGIDVKNNKIKGVLEGTDDDTVNLKQLNKSESGTLKTLRLDINAAKQQMQNEINALNRKLQIATWLKKKSIMGFGLKNMLIF